MSGRLIKGAAVAVVLALAAGWFGSPYLAVHQMRQAAQAGDAVEFNAHVDYPALRDNLKRQFIGSAQPGSDEATEPGSWKQMAGAVGRALRGVAVEGTVEALVRPQVVMRLLQVGTLTQGSRPAPATPSSPGEQSPPGAAGSPKTDWWTEREGLNRFTLHAQRTDQPDQRRIALVFERRGFLSWQLIDIRLPPR